MARQYPRHAPLGLRTRVKAEVWQPKLVEITHEDLRALTDAIVERGAPATAVHSREIVLQVYRWSHRERGQKVENRPIWCALDHRQSSSREIEH